jgi:Spy/CpxP family protein refolding chaperone
MRLDLRRAASICGFGLAFAVSGLAQDATPSTPEHPSLRHRLRDCLAILDLTDAQKTSVENVLAAAEPTVQADVAAVTSARQALEAALEATPPDACTVGTDALAVQFARETLGTERQTILNQILAVLQPDQQSRLQGCLDAPFPDVPTGADESSD